MVGDERWLSGERRTLEWSGKEVYGGAVPAYAHLVEIAALRYSFGVKLGAGG